jgi:hypothetical protein
LKIEDGMFTMGTSIFYHVLCNQIWDHFLPQYDLHPAPNLYPCILLHGLIFAEDCTNILLLKAYFASYSAPI